MQFTDTHWKRGSEKDQMTKKLMEDILDAEKPDFVAFTGDNLYIGGSDGSSDYARENPLEQYNNLIAPVIDRGIPWASVFGNHDVEGLDISREDMMEAKMAHGTCYSQYGPEDIKGVGNFLVEIKGASEDKTQAVLYFLDSGTNSDLSMGGYDYIGYDQIQWYIDQSKRLRGLNNGIPLPALGFFHIPLPEYKDVWYYNTCYGEKHEEVCSPKVNTGFFAAMLKMADVMGVFVGHDHINDYWGDLYGIKLCYGRGTGYDTYGREGFQRGARIIELKEGQKRFDTWLRLDDGSVIKQQKRHEPSGQRPKDE